MSIVNILTTIYGVMLLPSFFIFATMNAIRDENFVGVNAFKMPFNFVYTMAFLALLVLTAYSFYHRFKKKTKFQLGINISITTFSICGIIILLAAMPCFVDSTIRETLTDVVKKSMFCTSYSNRTYIGVIQFSFIAGVLLLLSSGIKRGSS
ncbi:hypothetical protein [Shewanella japonica]|uniref:hypothetical protein n=1 Tax=Shewanella japonica TaxID=93973 RepID=UPI000E720292|nr:hypothetical protein [Shewanella japonica]